MYYTWDNRERERAGPYLSRNSRNSAHFTGELILSRPGSDFDGARLTSVDGKNSYYDGYILEDKALAADYKRLTESNLREVLKSTVNDWRIYNDSGHFIDPPGPFTGEIFVKPEGWIGWATSLRVRRDLITACRRVPYITLD